MLKGVRGVRLNVTRVGGRIFTTEADIVDFSERLNGSAGKTNATTRRKADMDAARRRLSADGI